MKKLNAKDLKLLFGLKHHSVDCDKFDIEDFRDIKDCSSKLLRLEEEGKKELESFPELMQDVYNGLYKQYPHLVKDWEIHKSKIFNRAIMKMVMESRRYKELHALSSMDQVSSAMGVEAFSEDLMEIIKEEKEKIQQAQDIADEAEKLAQALQAQQGDEDDEEGDGEKTEGGGPPEMTLEEAKQRLEDMIEDFEKNMSEDKQLQQKLNSSLEKVRNETVETSNMISQWGMGEDPEFSKKPYREKMELMNKLRNSNKLRKIAELVGRMQSLALTTQNQKVQRGFEEVYDVVLGNDVSRLLPQELMKLMMPEREQEFFKDFGEGRCLQYALKGKEKQARGAIVCAIDESGSMSGEPEIWAKSVAMALYAIAAKQKRNFFVIHFSGERNPKSLKVHEFPKTDPVNIEKMVEMAEYFIGGGTDFETPLTRARMCIEEEESYHKADVVFITDGECAVRDSWLKDFKAWKSKKAVSVYSILIDAYYNSDGSLKEFSDNVHNLKSLKTNNSSDEPILLDIFQNI